MGPPLPPAAAARWGRPRPGSTRSPSTEPDILAIELSGTEQLLALLSAGWAGMPATCRRISRRCCVCPAAPAAPAGSAHCVLRSDQGGGPRSGHRGARRRSAELTASCVLCCGARANTAITCISGHAHDTKPRAVAQVRLGFCCWFFLKFFF